MVVKRRWNRLTLDDVLMAELVNLFGAHAGFEFIFNEAQSLRGQEARFAHEFNFAGRFNANHSRNITDLDLIGYPLKGYA